MPTIQFAGQEIALRGGESVLDGLLRCGMVVPHSCKSGVCHSCMMQAPDQPLPPRAQAGLKDTLRAQGYFLACVCHPPEALAIRAPGPDAQVGATIASVTPLSDTVVRVRVATAVPFDYRPGQFVTLLRDDGLARSYSLASLPTEGTLELHVRKVDRGSMSGWLHAGQHRRTAMRVQGPSGNCFYLPGRPEQPLLLAGTGTGLAPLYGIVRDALAHGHTGPIWLFHGAVDHGGLYLVDELRAVSRRHTQFHYVPTVLTSPPDGVGGPQLATGALDDIVLSRCASLDTWKAYLCGDPVLVNRLRKKLFLAGMPSRHIYADPFVSSVAGTNPGVAG